MKLTAKAWALDLGPYGEYEIKAFDNKIYECVWLPREYETNTAIIYCSDDYLNEVKKVGKSEVLGKKTMKECIAWARYHYKNVMFIMDLWNNRE